MSYSAEQIASLIGAKLVGNHDSRIDWILTDSRSLCFPEESLFFALRTQRNDGHHYVADLYRRGVRHFVVEAIPGSPEDFADADVSEVEEYIKSCGLYKTKARDIVLMAQCLRDNYNCVVPDTIEELTKLPGIGRKTANLIVGDIFGKPAVVVDTHCIRLTHRLGIHNIKDPKKIEFMLRDLLPPEESNDFCHRLVLHGRAVCDARKPKCEICCMNDFCPKNI